MLDERYLVRGLDTLSRATQGDYFADGHRGASMIAAVYLCREHHAEEGVGRALANLIDSWCHTSPVCAPAPEEPHDPGQISVLLATLRQTFGAHRQVGHDVIFGSLALKALRDVPKAATPARIAGICRTVSAMQRMPLPGDDDVALPDMADQPAAARFILNEYLMCAQRFEGRGQGWSGHLLTFGRALLDLCSLGYADLARQAEPGFYEYVRRIRMGPNPTDKPRPEHTRNVHTPLQSAYWALRNDTDLRLGHMIKYPYGLYGLMALADDDDLRRRVAREAYRVI